MLYPIKVFKLALAREWSLQPHSELNLVIHSFSVAVLSTALCTDPVGMLLLQAPLSSLHWKLHQQFVIKCNYEDESTNKPAG